VNWLHEYNYLITMALAVLGISWLILYGIYFGRDYPGDPERPPHFILCSFLFVVGVAALITGLSATSSAAISDVSPDAASHLSALYLINTFVWLLALGSIGLLVDVVWRFVRRMVRRARG